MGHGNAASSAAGAAADSNATYHRTIEFAPTPAALFADSRRAKISPVFCGVSVARKRSAERDGGAAARGRGAGRAGKVTVVSFAPTMSLANLLVTPADVRLSRASDSRAKEGRERRRSLDRAEKNEEGGGGVWSETIERGAEVPVFECPPDEEVWFSWGPFGVCCGLFC